MFGMRRRVPGILVLGSTVRDAQVKLGYCIVNAETGRSHPTGKSDRRGLKVGIIELLTDKLITSRVERVYSTYLTKQYVSVAPQVVAVWCRKLGHEVHYTTYYGQADPRSLLPGQLDVVFVSSYTRASTLAYALAKLLRKEGIVTVIGGPHAKSYPVDCLRFFDLAVLECDKELISDILLGQFDYPSIVSSGRPLTDIPSVEERMPEIHASVFDRGRRTLTTLVPILASVGCPYACDFCTDWDSSYTALPADQLEADLRYLAEHLPGVLIAYHDPNFGVRFDETMEVIERIPRKRRNPYVMESSLAIMKESRLQRLKDTRCVFVAPGVESWNSYSNKAGVGSKQGRDKLEQVVAHFDLLKDYVPGLQANFLLGLDCDMGSDPVELTKEFIRRSPQVWPTINIPTPLGGTPLFDEVHGEGRILCAMPFSLYFTPYYMATKLKHYDPIEFYDHLIDIYSTIGSARMLAKRVLFGGHPFFRFLNSVRTLDDRRDIREFRTVRDMLASDKQFLAFHEGREAALPEFYHQRAKSRMGAYAELISSEERTPWLEPIDPQVANGRFALSY